jgi:hypothetical protein
MDNTPIINADDVVSVLHHHWVLCNDYYPEERQRLQHAIMNIFCSSTTNRVSAGEDTHLHAVLPVSISQVKGL